MCHGMEWETEAIAERLAREAREEDDEESVEADPVEPVADD